MSEKRNAVEEAIEELITDPDSPDKGHDAPPPQTIDAEPAGPAGGKPKAGR